MLPKQTYSLAGKWKTMPIKISFEAASRWQPSEISRIQAGANAWNDFFELVHGVRIFDVGPAGQGYSSTANQTSPACSSSTLADGVVLYKRYQTWSKGRDAIAVTSACYSRNASGLATYFNAILEFNYVNYFAPNSHQYPDLQSIATHELGHLLGLDHSCGALGAPNSGRLNETCPSFSTAPDHVLVAAVMYPKVPMTAADANGNKYGQVKQDLGVNDEGRANCIYGK